MTTADIILTGTVAASVYKLFDIGQKIFVEACRWHNRYKDFFISSEERTNMACNHSKIKSIYRFTLKELKEWKYSLGTK